MKYTKETRTIHTLSSKDDTTRATVGDAGAVAFFTNEHGTLEVDYDGICILLEFYTEIRNEMQAKACVNSNSEKTSTKHRRKDRYRVVKDCFNCADSGDCPDYDDMVKKNKPCADFVPRQ